MSDRERTDYRAQRMGFVFQFYNLMPVLTAVENVELPLLVARVRRRRRVEALARSSWWASRRVRAPAGRASGGERQRVTIARAMVNDPAIVWADEPTGDLDSENAAEIIALMRRLNGERGLTLLIVTHDLAVGRATDRIIRMLDGDRRRRASPGRALMVARVTLAEVDAVRLTSTAPSSCTTAPSCRPFARRTGMKAATSSRRLRARHS